MYNKLFKLINKFINRETISYLFFGIFTTIVDAASFYITNNILHINYIISTVIAWILAVMFAYITNKVWVFKSNTTNLLAIIKEVISFIIARLFSLLFTLLWMFFTVEYLSLDEFLSKLLANIFVVIMNYFFSKLFIFKNN